jgi:sulfatase maturation enzyme AslB (radical SAM superfamily)
VLCPDEDPIRTSAALVVCTVNGVNVERPLVVYRFIRDELGAERIRFVPLVEMGPDASVSERSVRPESFGAFLSAVFDEWIRHDVGRVFVETFELRGPHPDYLRAGYEAFLRHIDHPMRMIQRLVQRGIPAAVVMKLVAKEDAARELAHGERCTS